MWFSRYSRWHLWSVEVLISSRHKFNDYDTYTIHHVKPRHKSRLVPTLLATSQHPNTPRRLTFQESCSSGYDNSITLISSCLTKEFVYISHCPKNLTIPQQQLNFLSVWYQGLVDEWQPSKVFNPQQSCHLARMRRISALTICSQVNLGSLMPRLLSSELQNGLD